MLARSGLATGHGVARCQCLHLALPGRWQIRPEGPESTPQQTSEQLPPHLGERLHSSDGEATSNDRHGRSPAKPIMARSSSTLTPRNSRMLHLCAFSERERILDVDAQVSNGALDFRVAEQDLHGAQVARLLVDDRGFGSSQ